MLGVHSESERACFLRSVFMNMRYAAGERFSTDIEHNSTDIEHKKEETL